VACAVLESVPWDCRVFGLRRVCETHRSSCHGGSWCVSHTLRNTQTAIVPRRNTRTTVMTHARRSFPINTRRGDRRLQATGESPSSDVENSERTGKGPLHLGTVAGSPPDVPASSRDNGSFSTWGPGFPPEVGGVKLQTRSQNLWPVGMLTGRGRRDTALLLVIESGERMGHRAHRGNRNLVKLHVGGRRVHATEDVTFTERSTRPRPRGRRGLFREHKKVGGIMLARGRSSELETATD
jgi:hypothetical protein